MCFCLSKPIECFTISSEGRKQTSEGSVSSYSLVETNKMGDQDCINSVNFDSGNSGYWKLGMVMNAQFQMFMTQRQRYLIINQSKCLFFTRLLNF